MRTARRSIAAFGFGAAAAGSAAAAHLPDATACAALARPGAVHWTDGTTRIAEATWRESGMMPAPPGLPNGLRMPPVMLPAHCEIVGVMHERTGVDGQHYAIRFHLRLPAGWNGRFLMQGGGGTNGELGDAIGRTGFSTPPAITQGYAVLSQDSGHDNAVNTVPDRGGASAFGFDPQARADYGGASLRPTVEAARAAIAAFYGKAPRTSYFYGCSKGGQEGMMLATRYPDLFDGIVAAAPGFSLPRAAVAEAWNSQAFAAVARKTGQPVSFATMAQAFTATDGALFRAAILAACDKLDGAEDGIVGDFARCTDAVVVPQLQGITCKGAKQASCLAADQVAALRKVHDGARDPSGRTLYPGFYWDAGWGDSGWRLWMVGEGPIPPINVAMGAPSLAAIFGTPPIGVNVAVPTAALDYALGFDMARDPARIYATDAAFPRSAWTDIGARATTDLSAFARRGGKLIVPQGVSDPVFSLQDTVQWLAEVNLASDGAADRFVRVFPIPGMAHCIGGPGTDQVDSFTALVAWVEQGRAPDAIPGKAGPLSPWPGRTRPICAFPKVARYRGAGDLADAASFVCA